MARIPSMTTEQCEALLGPRGACRIDSNNRATVRKWLSAQGFPALFSVGLSMIELANAYNQIDGRGLEQLRRKLAKGMADGDDCTPVIEGDVSPSPVANNAPVASPEAPALPVSPQNPQNQDITRILRDLILNGYQPGIDEQAVRDIVQDALSNVAPPAPAVMHVQYPDKPAIAVEGLAHPEFERALKYLIGGGNVMLVGPAGCGKTYLAKQLAKALDVSLGVLCGSAGASESEVKGWLLPVAGGAFEYSPSQFVTLYEGGNALICLDEMDAFDANMLLCVNVPLANGHMYVPQRRHAPEIPRGDRVFFVGTMNTFGTGANPLYAGRSTLDAATLDRFLIISVDYDKRLEESIGLAGGLTPAEMAGIWELRDRCRESQLRRVISTRAFQKAVIMKQAGDSWREIRDRLLEGWTKDEKNKVGA
jgi:cobaltochelatase CobS